MSGACPTVIAAAEAHKDKSAVLCRVIGAIAFLAKNNNVNRDHLLELNAIELTVGYVRLFPNHKGLLQVVCHALLYLYFWQYPEKIAELKELGALDSRGWVLDLDYDKLVAYWKPDEVLLALKRERSGGIGTMVCSFIMCT